MKAKNMLVLIALFFSVISLGSCSNDDNNFEFSTSLLKQTQWNGTLQETDDWGNGEYVAYVGLVFLSENMGKCSVKRGDTSPFEYNFEYSINGNMLYISEGKGDLNGYWLLIHFDENSIIVEKGTGGEGAYKGVLTLTRKI